MRNRVSEKSMGNKSHDIGRLSSSFGMEIEASEPERSSLSNQNSVNTLAEVFAVISPVINLMLQ